MKADILEIFQSIQGEGKYAGVRQVFVRFFECNMRCVWCDTPHSIGDTTRKYDEYPLEDLCAKVIGLSAGCHSVSITGGEPMMQTPFLKEFLPRLKAEGLRTYLETNGVYHEELKDIIAVTDIIAMDIKLPSSTKCRPYWEEHARFIETGRGKDFFIKTVISGDTAAQDVRRAVDITAEIDPGILFILQPNFFEMKSGAMDKCLEFYDICREKLDDVRIIPQTHKFMKLR